MLSAVIQSVQSQGGGGEVQILVAHDTPYVHTSAGKIQTLKAWPTRRRQLGHCMERIRDFEATTTIILGADVIDGFYSPSTALRLLALADLQSRFGCRTAVLGFSFNKHPSPAIAKALKLLSPRVVLNVRDPISLERLPRLPAASFRLVADAAFMLAPATDSKKVAATIEWIRKIKISKSKQIIGINIHPLLFHGGRDADVARLISCFSMALQRLMREHNIGLVFISHDDRPSVGDAVCLQPLFESLAPEYRDFIHYPEEQLNAAELKAVASRLDGAITGRMHLSIAALGCEVPVAVVTYQDKFEGLLAHFALPPELAIPAHAALDEDRLYSWISNFIGHLSQYRESVQDRLPSVLALSRRNLDFPT